MKTKYKFLLSGAEISSASLLKFIAEKVCYNTSRVNALVDICESDYHKAQLILKALKRNAKECGHASCLCGRDYLVEVRYNG